MKILFIGAYYRGFMEIGSSAALSQATRPRHIATRVIVQVLIMRIISRPCKVVDKLLDVK
jgi:hypothetical protein